MKYANFSGRIVAWIIDYIIVAVCFVIATIITVNMVLYNVGYPQIALVILMIAIIFLIQILYNVIFLYNNAYFIVFMIFFLVETLCYSFQEIFMGRTFGFRNLAINIEYKGKKFRILRILLSKFFKDFVEIFTRLTTAHDVFIKENTDCL